MYKKICYISILINVILLTIIFWPQAKYEKAMIQQIKSFQNENNKEVGAEEFEEIVLAAETLLTDLSKEWDANVLKINFSQQMLNQLNEKELFQTLKLYKTLGKFQNSESKKVLIDHDQLNARIIRLESIFDNGKGVVQLALIKINKKWLIEGINITSGDFK